MEPFAFELWGEFTSKLRYKLLVSERNESAIDLSVRKSLKQHFNSFVHVDGWAVCFAYHGGDIFTLSLTELSEGFEGSFISPSFFVDGVSALVIWELNFAQNHVSRVMSLGVEHNHTD